MPATGTLGAGGTASRQERLGRSCPARGPERPQARFNRPVPPLASWYGVNDGSGALTASGESFNPEALTCAHKSLPFGTLVTLSCAGRAVRVRVNDRGPYIAGREYDLTPAAFKRLAPLGAGVIKVEVNK